VRVRRAGCLARADRRVREHADDRAGQAGPDREHRVGDHGDRGRALDLQVFEQPQVAEARAAGEADAQSVLANALA
jgi:hypothetical protein